MSLREAHLCDHPGCNMPRAITCSLCKRDCCKAHRSDRYLTAGIGMAESDSNAVAFVGKLVPVVLCVDCASGLDQHTRGINQLPINGVPFSSLVAPLRDPIIEAATAFLAEQKLASGKK